ncbi:MAG: Crp/Fnr family transcriptional regulator [Cyclobacteriaceae bacterium]
MNPYIKRIKELSKKMDPGILVEVERGFVEKEYAKGSFLLRVGQICSSHFLIQSGVARKFYRHNEKEITTEIYFHDDVAVSLDSYIMKRPSDIYIEALSPLKVMVIDYSRFQKASQKYPEVMMLDKMFIEYYAVWFEQKLKEFQTLDATTRYLSMLEKEPRIIKHIPVTIIASYLNISLETLSRIRSKISA